MRDQGPDNTLWRALLSRLSGRICLHKCPRCTLNVKLLNRKKQKGDALALAAADGEGGGGPNQRRGGRQGKRAGRGKKQVEDALDVFEEEFGGADLASTPPVPLAPMGSCPSY